MRYWCDSCNGGVAPVDVAMYREWVWHKKCLYDWKEKHPYRLTRTPRGWRVRRILRKESSK